MQRIENFATTPYPGILMKLLSLACCAEDEQETWKRAKDLLTYGIQAALRVEMEGAIPGHRRDL